MTYDGCFERETSQNYSYLVLKPKKELKGVRRAKKRIKNSPHLNLQKGIVIFSSTEQKHERRRVLGTTDPFPLLFHCPSISNIVYGCLSSLEPCFSISTRCPDLSNGTTVTRRPSVDASVVHGQPMSIQRQFDAISFKF